MTREDKILLLKDICARFPYGVICHTEKGDGHLCSINQTIFGTEYGLNISLIKRDRFYDSKTEEQAIKPYLRPMSSMTEEETDTYDRMVMCNASWVVDDWLLSHHFDYRGLIEKGLALEAPEGMYNKEESEKGSEIPIPKNVDEAVKTLAKILSKEDRDYLLENGAISMHDSLGRWIRNEWGLWTGSELKDELMNMNKGLNHPDDMSNYIIEEFIKYWNNKL